MSDFCPICGAPVEGEPHDCPVAGPRTVTPMARIAVASSPSIARAGIRHAGAAAASAPARGAGTGGNSG